MYAKVDIKKLTVVLSYSLPFKISYNWLFCETCEALSSGAMSSNICTLLVLGGSLEV